MLKEQYDLVSNELLEKKVKLEELREKNGDSASKIRELNKEVEGII